MTSARYRKRRIMLALVAIVALACLALVWRGYAARSEDTNRKEADCASTECSSCAASNAQCERERTLRSAVEPIEYFDDEELDTYKGRRGDDYETEETEQFAYILHTMRQDEVKEWVRSLVRRGINMPDELKDEVIMMMEDGHS